MRYWKRSVLAIGLVVLLSIALILAVPRGSNQLPDALIMHDAIDVLASSKGWSITEATYQSPSDYDQISQQLTQQMVAQGWTALRVAQNLGPSIFNPDPAPLLFQRAYWFGLMDESAYVSGTNNVPTGVHVVVTRVIRWPPVVRRFIRWWYTF